MEKQAPLAQLTDAELSEIVAGYEAMLAVRAVIELYRSSTHISKQDAIDQIARLVVAD